MIKTYNEEECEQFSQYIQSKGFEYINFGAFRLVYARKNVVIKVPRSMDGMIDNYIEAKAYRKYRDNKTNIGMLLMPCRLLPNGCLMMPKIACGNVPYDFEAPYKSLTDGWQHAFYKGKVRVYDFAIDISERLSWENEAGISNSWFADTYSQYGSKKHLRGEL